MGAAPGQVTPNAEYLPATAAWIARLPARRSSTYGGPRWIASVRIVRGGFPALGGQGLGAALWSAVLSLAARWALSRMLPWGERPRALGALAPSGAR